RLRLRLVLRPRLCRLAAGIDAEDARDHVLGAFVQLRGNGLDAGLALGLLAAHLLHAAQLRLALGAVVAASLFGIAQKIVGAAGLREAHRRIRVVVVLVGMHGFRERTPGSLYLFLARIALDAQHRIGITHNFPPFS